MRAIETEELRLRRRVAHATGHAGIAAREDKVCGGLRRLHGLAIRRWRFRRYDHLTTTGFEGELHRLGQPAPRGLRGDQPVDDHIDRVLEQLLERRRFLDAADAAVDPCPREALPDEIRE